MELTAALPETVFIGDTIRLRQTIQSVQAINEKSGLLNISEEVLNQSDVVVLTYVAKMLVRRRPSP